MVTNDDLDHRLRALTQLGSWDWPEDSRQLLIAGLESSEPSQRGYALDALCEAMDDDLARRALRLAAEDPDVTLRGRALIALGPALEEAELVGYEDPIDRPGLSSSMRSHILAQLRRLYLDPSHPKLVRRRALEVAVRSPTGWQQSAVRAAWASGDVEWQVTAVFAMGLLRGFEVEIGAAMDHEAVRVQYEAVRAAGQAGVEGLAPRILSLAANATADRDLRLASIEALGLLAPTSALAVLENLASSPDAELAEAASEALEEWALWAVACGDQDTDWN